MSFFSSLTHQGKLRIKRCLDHLRPYPTLLRHFPAPAWLATQMGSVLAKDANVSGPLSFWEPAWVQINGKANVRGLHVAEGHCCYVAEGVSISDYQTQGHTFALASGVHTATLVTSPPCITVDFEGCSHMRNRHTAQGEAIQAASAVCARHMHNAMKNCELPSIWYTVGNLFSDTYMESVIAALEADKHTTIGWHSMDHTNFRLSTRDAAIKDLDALQTIREKTGLPLNAMCFPYNAIGWLEDCVDAGITEFRAYIGQYYLPFHMKFNSFAVRGTSMFLGPNTIAACQKLLPAPQGFTFFCHDVDWIGHDMRPLFTFFEQFKDSLENNSV